MHLTDYLNGKYRYWVFTCEGCGKTHLTNQKQAHLARLFAQSTIGAPGVMPTGPHADIAVTD